MASRCLRPHLWPLECTVLQFENVNPCILALKQDFRCHTYGFPQKNVNTNRNIPWTRLMFTQVFANIKNTSLRATRTYLNSPDRRYWKQIACGRFQKRVVNRFMSYFKRINDRKRRARAPVKRLEGQGQVHGAARRGARDRRGMFTAHVGLLTGFLLYSGNP